MSGLPTLGYNLSSNGCFIPSATGCFWSDFRCWQNSLSGYIIIFLVIRLVLCFLLIRGTLIRLIKINHIRRFSVVKPPFHLVHEFVIALHLNQWMWWFIHTQFPGNFLFNKSDVKCLNTHRRIDQYTAPNGKYIADEYYPTKTKMW